ncbi:high affinity immunoglobulin gamma Fc receptor I-like isoform X2 [Clupea harengus]|uniref:high affinity immunoglobulin gamma Fc receptor I-like isoform X2 n=1 Tax=Clupea harengus TaxID=7950 RepID=UPI0012ABBDC3|nr:high affinity immunoglobulin gamma Fc receptor I-like isoform X2 [Clupea harengus]
MHLLLSFLVISALHRWTNAQINRKAVVEVTEGRSYLLSGGSLRLTCDVPEDPYHWTFDWFFNGQKLVSGKSYAIRQAQVIQSGNYTCMGAKESELDQTGLLRTEISAPLPVDINGGWIILEAPSKAPIMEETMTLTCRLRENYLDTEVIFYLNGREMWRQHNNTVTVPNLNLDHGGEYSCRAKWETQGLYHSVHTAHSPGVSVTILEILTTPKLSASITSVGRDKDLKLTCTTKVNTRKTGSFPIHYYFLKNDNPLGPATSKNIFTIRNVGREDSNWYSCRAVVPKLNQEKWSTPERVNIRMSG